MNKRVWMGIVLLGAATAGAQEAAKTNESEIVVTATREWTEASWTPASITVVTSDEIERKGANNLSDVLRDVPGVQVRSLSGGPVAEVAMRGGGENSQGRVLVLMDGRRLNNPDMAAMNWLQIPLNQVERVEVLRGAQTSLYGDYASQGVINIITKKGAAEPRRDFSVIAGSYNTFVARAGAAGSAGTMPLTGAANAEWQSSDGFRDRSGYESYGAGGRAGYDWSEDSGLSIAGSWYRSDYELPGDLTLREMKDNRRQSHNPDDKTDNLYLNMGLDYFARPVQGVQFETVAGWSGRESESDVASWFMFSDNTMNSYSVQPKTVVEGEWGGLSQRTTLGVDLYKDLLEVDRFTDAERSSKTIAADLDKDTVGAYVRHQVDLTPQWIVHAGGRVEQARLSAEADSFGMRVVDDDKTQHGSTWEGGVTYAFESRSKLFARAGSVYRYPFVDEQISYYGFGTDGFFRDLDAEKGLNLETGVELGWNRTWRAAATLFRLDMRDEVAWDPIANSNANLDETRRQGAELSGSWKPVDRLELLASYTWTDAEFTSGLNDGKNIPLVPEHLASLTLRLGLPLDLTLDTTGHYTGSSPLGGDISNAGDKLDAYSTLDMMVRYAPAGKSFSAFVGVENLTDETYAAVAYKGYLEDGYYPSPGQNWRVGLSTTF
ncbi:MAG: TonB-dependent receptor [Kiritimatiellia bacterium]